MEVRGVLGSLVTEVSEDVAVVEALVIAVDDVLFGDVGDGGTLFEEATCRHARSYCSPICIETRHVEYLHM